MAKEYYWEIQLDGKATKVTCVLQGNKYRIFLEEDHVTDVYRLSNRQMRYGMEAPFTIGTEQCLLVVWDEIPDLVWQGRMLTRDAEYAPARERRRANMEGLYTGIAILGVLLLAGVAAYAYLGMVNPDSLRFWTALLCGGVYMVGSGIYHRGKWIEQIP